MTLPPSLVWLPADHRLLGNDRQQMPFIVLGDKYARAVKEVSALQSVVFPLAEASAIESLLTLVDGVVLPGSPSNIHPSHFGEQVEDESLPLDPHRDALTLELVRCCVRMGIPLFGICRGFQEINVAMGGTLLQQVHTVPGMMDHREDKSATYDIQYGLAHEIQLMEGSALVQWAGANKVRVNSVHGQGVGRLADGLKAIAHADDGLIEAFEVEGASAFAYAVQWHPEWKPAENHFYSAMFRAFGDACRTRQRARMAQIRATCC